VRAADPHHIADAFLDMPLVGLHDHSCGVVDDIELAEIEPGIWELAAILVGPGAWRRRRPRWLTALLPKLKAVRIAKADIASATQVVRLMRPAAELGLATTERRLLALMGGR